MVQLTGKAIFDAIAIGPVCVYQKAQTGVVKRHVDDTEGELRRFETATETAREELAFLHEKAVSGASKEGAAILAAQRLLLEDEAYRERITDVICHQKVNAEFAVATAKEHFVRMFAAMDTEYMQERAMDVADISERLISLLVGKSSVCMMEQPVILMAKELLPSETVRFDRSKLLALVTEQGSTNSHTAILARAMGIPAIAGIKADTQYDGKMAVVDGNTGTVIIDPAQEVLKEYRQRKAEQEQYRLLLQEMKGKPTVTRDGKEISLYANISDAQEVEAALLNDAGGIGLFRSEYLYLGAEDYPTEEAQFRSYKAVAERMAGKPVIIRTLDIGADKQVDYFGLEQETNPAMGLRAIRICLTKPEILKTQLRAILRAGVYGNVSILFPMITSVWEIRRIKEILTEVKRELAKEQIPFREAELGVMIETPAAVMISELLAKEVDFFSIGTNDLTQYTLAVDRQNESLDPFYDAHHEAILRMIEMTVANGHKEHIRVGICGELAADREVLPRLIRMGVDELSVSCPYLLPLRKQIRELPF